MRNMGGLRKTMPVTFWLYMIGTLALAGIFPFAGFWSKDEILADAFTGRFHRRLLAVDHCGLLHRLLMGRQIWMVFFGEPRHEAAAHAEESKPMITVPLMVLAFLSIFGGALNLPGLHTFMMAGTYDFEVHAGEFVMSVAVDFNGAGTHSHLHLLAYLRTQSAQGRSARPAQEAARFHLHGHGKQMVRG